MADLFEQYAADFSELVASVRASVTSKHASADARRSILQNAESEVEEANDLLVQMEIEVRSYPQSVRERYTAKLQELKGEYEKLQKELQPRASTNVAMEGYSDADGEADGALSQRQRLLQGTSVLEQGSERLAASTRLALETEDIGANILQDLQSQREQIEHSRDTLHGANTHIDRSSRTLQQMIRRAKQQKVVTVAIIVVLVLLILLILYAKL